MDQLEQATAEMTKAVGAFRGVLGVWKFAGDPTLVLSAGLMAAVSILMVASAKNPNLDFLPAMQVLLKMADKMRGAEPEAVQS